MDRDAPRRRGLLQHDWAVALLVLLVVVAVRAPAFPLPPDNDTSANAYHAQRIVEGEPLYGTHHPAHHLPGVYYGTALAFLLLGDGYLSIQLFLIPWIFLTAWLVYRLGRTLFDPTTGIWAAVLFAMQTSHVRLLGLSGECELWANLPRVAGVLLLVRWLPHRAGNARFVWIGLLGAVAILFKAVYVTPVAVAGLALLIDWGTDRRSVGAATRLLSRATWMSAGLAAGLLLAASYWWALGLADRLWMVFTIGRDYVGYRTEDSSVLDILMVPLSGLRKANAVLLLLALVGAVLLLANRWGGRRPALPRLVLPIWLLVSFLEAGVTRTAFWHYYLLIVPPLCLLGAAAFVRFYRFVRERMGSRPPALRGTVLGVLVLLVLLVGYHRNVALMRYSLRYALGVYSYERFLQRARPYGIDIEDVLAVAEYVRSHTGPDDRIYSWSEHTQVYYLSGRRSSAPFIWPIQAVYIDDPAVVLGPSTRYVVVGEVLYGSRPDWLIEGLERDYFLETIIRGQRVYRRRAA